ncbi:MAG TPA: T9SS type A sorting domain-containing protein [Bacteroidia bacterium]|nr:T9SS type A sorting domain-containing protein [Bacteroidia bacterium]HNO70835.1 T9SS type A sorting domain-containing protein [Bacteroidia bacterium]
MNKILLIILTTSILVSISAFTVLSSAGYRERTGSPIDGKDCSECHSGGSTKPIVNINSSPGFGTNNTYISGGTYTINVVCSGNYPKYGFGLEILNSNTKTAGDAGILDTSITNCKKSSVAGRPTNILHAGLTGNNNSTTFSFRWKAPLSGNAYVYYCVVGANNNGMSSGDEVVTSSLILTADVSSASEIKNTFYDISLFPNPTHSFVYLNYYLNETTDLHVEILNIEGKKTAFLHYETQLKGEHRKKIDIAKLDLPAGIYWISISSDNYRVTKKLLIL